MSKTFNYFAYGSNLLAHRIHINNPTAVRCGIGKIENYRLDFGYYSNRWKGAAATIVPTEGREVWGAMWKIDLTNLPDLDRQEGVEQGIYFPFEVDVKCAEENRIVKCRVYQQTEDPEFVKDLDDVPAERLPSAAYLKTILLGAEESKLPSDYVEFLKKIRHNGYTGDVEIKGLQLENK